MQDKEETTVVVATTQTTIVNTRTKIVTSTDYRNGGSKATPTTMCYGGRVIDLAQLQQNPGIIKFVLESTSMLIIDNNETQEELTQTITQAQTITQEWAKTVMKAIDLNRVLGATMYMMACAIQQILRFNGGMPASCVNVLKSYLKDQFKPYKDKVKDYLVPKFRGANEEQRHLIDKSLKAMMKQVDRAVDKCTSKIVALVRDAYMRAVFILMLLAYIIFAHRTASDLFVDI